MFPCDNNYFSPENLASLSLCQFCFCFYFCLLWVKIIRSMIPPFCGGGSRISNYSSFRWSQNDKSDFSTNCNSVRHLTDISFFISFLKWLTLLLWENNSLFTGTAFKSKVVNFSTSYNLQCLWFKPLNCLILTYYTILHIQCLFISATFMKLVCGSKQDKPHWNPWVLIAIVNLRYYILFITSSTMSLLNFKSIYIYLYV